MEISKNLANSSIYSNIIGIGLDLAQKTVTNTSKTPGCNYCNVLSSDDFNNLMIQEFDYIVTPVAFNLNFGLSSPSLHIQRGFGSPEVNSTFGPNKNIIISTEFPALKNSSGETKGGVLLFRLSNTEQNKEEDKTKEDKKKEEGEGDLIRFWSKYQNRRGVTKKSEEKIKLEVKIENGDKGLIKAISLVKFVDFVNRYLMVKNEEEGNKIEKTDEQKTLEDCYEDQINAGNRKEKFIVFLAWFEEMAKISGDLDGERDLLYRIGELDQILDDKINNRKRSREEGEKEEKEEKKDKGEEMKEDKDEEEKRQAKKMRMEREEEATCVVCLDEKKNVLIVPCNHLCLCKTCSLNVKQCPMCRGEIGSFTTVYV
eukprot:TRINITY_DN413_c1_g3_i3.p1 TRINITY_DN413_c1_g3~~TRINITY_DN413_c1_g3_i3.p1  ORF type:complete len:370 (-),score=143.40 TRINITY_DN413_c1_g3_i3:57-1166(-)